MCQRVIFLEYSVKSAFACIIQSLIKKAENHPEHKLTHSNCNIHARRYFADAVNATGSKTAKEAVKIYEEIFTAENKLRDLFRENKISETDFLKLHPAIQKFSCFLMIKIR